MKLAAADRHGDLYPERHLNVFVPFQAHALDHNVTRAVIATLRWSRPELTREFLTEVAGVDASATSRFHFDLGACDYEDFDPSRVARQVVLGISVVGEIAPNLPSLDDVDQAAIRALLATPMPLEARLDELRRTLGRHELTIDDAAVLAHTLEELEEGSLPDGWVFSGDEGGTCVLIEAKLTRYLDLYQLSRYGEVYFARRFGRDQVVLRSWRQVAAFFRAHCDDQDPRTAFLCRQLHDYLDLLGLAVWDGFKPYDFDADAFQETLPKFLHFAEQARTQAVDLGQPLAALRATPRGARIGFPDAGVPGELELELLEPGIRIELRVGDAPAGRLAGREGVDAVLAAGEAGNPLEGLELGQGYAVRIERLLEDGAGVAWVDRETARLPLATAEFPEALAELRLQHPAEGTRDATGHARRGVLAIGLLIERDEALGGGEALVARVAEALADLARVARRLAPAVAQEH